MMFSKKLNFKTRPKNSNEETENRSVPMIILFNGIFVKILEYKVLTIPATSATMIKAKGRFSTPNLVKNKALTVGFTINKVEIIKKIYNCIKNARTYSPSLISKVFRKNNFKESLIYKIKNWLMMTINQYVKNIKKNRSLGKTSVFYFFTFGFI